MADVPNHRKKSKAVNRLFRAVGSAGSAVGSAVGGVAGDFLRTAGKTARDVGGRASVTFTQEVDATPERTLRELAESLTHWMVQEQQGRADLQQQRPSTVELTEMGQVSSFFEVSLEEPGLMGRRFRFVLRHRPLVNWEANFPGGEEKWHAQALLVLEWPKEVTEEPNGIAIVVWDQAAVVGERNSARDLVQAWLKDELSGTFVHKSVSPSKTAKAAQKIPLWGRDAELEEVTNLLRTPTRRLQQGTSLVSLAAPGGTGKSFFLRSLKAAVAHRVTWAGVDHQSLKEKTTGRAVLADLLSGLARQLKDRGVSMERFTKELRGYRKGFDDDGSAVPTGFLKHFKKAAEAAAGINPVLGAASAGVAFLASWGQEAKEESEALARDDAIRALTEAFHLDLAAHAKDSRQKSLCWARPVLVFDTYEWLAPLVDTWMRTEFLTQDFLSETRCIVILAGREALVRTDTRWSEWQHRVLNISLKPFDQSTTLAYLSSLGVDKERATRLYDLTEGLPLFLSLASQLDDPEQSIAILTQRVMEEVPPESRADFLRAAVLESFDRGNIERLFPEKTDEERDRLVHALLAATFTVAQEGKRAFLPPVRRVFQKALSLEVGQREFENLRARVED